MDTCQDASLALGLVTHVGNLTSATITPQCIGQPHHEAGDRLGSILTYEASSLSSSAAISASVAIGDRWTQLENLKETCACQVNVDTTEHLPSYVRSYFYSSLV